MEKETRRKEALLYKDISKNLDENLKFIDLNFVEIIHVIPILR